MTENKALELVTFQLNDDVTDEMFLETVGRESDWIKIQPGFVSRDLVRSDDGAKWIEVVWWHSLAEAKAAGEKAMRSETCAPMFSTINFDCTVMLHGTPAIPQITI